ncbi:hypothetical protein V5N11_031783 [Cardamine amara subsp. amara]|uniref:Uncharacterized protein n=1 Tax=Cardamine amara subsp. amara TaxID=228776 RepID=A0ABD0ZPU5_CARAN
MGKYSVRAKSCQSFCSLTNKNTPDVNNPDKSTVKISRCELCCEIIIAILLPPVGVCLRHGCCTVEFFICLVLTCLGYLPGIIYAIYAILFLHRDEYFDEYRRPIYYVA